MSPFDSFGRSEVSPTMTWRDRKIPSPLSPIDALTGRRASIAVPMVAFLFGVNLPEMLSSRKSAMAKEERNYETACNTIKVMEMQQTLQALNETVYKANFNATFYNEEVVELCAKLATQALVLACNSQRTLDAWNEQRA